MINDDGDIIRGLGFVSIYSAWVEEDVDELLRCLVAIEPFNDKKQRLQIGKKLQYTFKIVERLNSPHLQNLLLALKEGKGLFERRNVVLHGRIYVGHDKTDYLKSGRSNVVTRQITSAELYKLANDFKKYRGYLIGPLIFRLPHAIKQYKQASSLDET
jgi:hypothetical protein